jgi:hypothetical protein
MSLVVLARLALAASPAFAGTTIIPDPTLTPGAVRTTDATAICSTGTRELRHGSRDRDDRIMVEYGLSPGGASRLRNRSPDPVGNWGVGP